MHFAFNVMRGRKKVDTVFYQFLPGSTIADSCETVRKSLVDHDGLSPEIRVTWPRGQRVTEDYFELQGDYGHGWECICAETTWKAARQRKREYEANEGGCYRIVKKRERV